MRWSDSRTRASRTAANASKSRSSSASPFSNRCAELGGLRAQLVVGELLEVGLERRDVRGLLGEPLHAPAFAEAKGLLERVRSRASRTGYRLPAYEQRVASTSQRSPSSRRRTDDVLGSTAPRRAARAPARGRDRAARRRRASRPSRVDDELGLVARRGPAPRRPRSATRRPPSASRLRRTASARYGGDSAPRPRRRAARAPSSGSSSSTTSVPSASATKWTLVAASGRGASAVATASQRRARGDAVDARLARAARRPSRAARPPATAARRRRRASRVESTVAPASASRSVERLRAAGRAADASLLGDVAVVVGVPPRLDDAALAVALHLALELVDELVDRRLHVGRRFARAQRRALREDRRLRDLAVGDRRVLAARRARPRPASARRAACRASPAFARRTRGSTG